MPQGWRTRTGCAKLVLILSAVNANTGRLTGWAPESFKPQGFRIIALWGRFGAPASLRAFHFKSGGHHTASRLRRPWATHYRPDPPLHLCSSTFCGQDAGRRPSPPALANPGGQNFAAKSCFAYRQSCAPLPRRGARGLGCIPLRSPIQPATGASLHGRQWDRRSQPELGSYHGRLIFAP